MALIVLDPTDERQPVERQPSTRLKRLAGTVALLDIVKPRGDVFLDRLAELLPQRRPEVTVLRFRKPTFTKPAPEPLLRQIAERAGAVIEALAD
jgi:hypothetical protein